MGTYAKLKITKKDGSVIEHFQNDDGGFQGELKDAIVDIINYNCITYPSVEIDDPKTIKKMAKFISAHYTPTIGVSTDGDHIIDIVNSDQLLALTDNVIELTIYDAYHNATIPHWVTDIFEFESDDNLPKDKREHKLTLLYRYMVEFENGNILFGVLTSKIAKIEMVLL